MIIAVIGCGNVGANLLQHMADMPSIDKIFAVGRKGADEKAKAAIMDVAGVKPHDAHKIIGANNSCLSEADIIVFTAGFKEKEGETPQDVMKKNLSIIDHNLEGIQLKTSVIIITIAGPVEIIASYTQKLSNIDCAQVIGFGGDLDLNRLIYVLNGQGIDSESVAIVGEHGPRTIPVYDTESNYDIVAYKVRNFLAEIGRLAGQKRNLATAPLLANLIQSIIEDKREIHYVAGYHPDYDRYITWPYRIGREGILRSEPLTLPPRAKKDLDSLLEEQDKRRNLFQNSD